MSFAAPVDEKVPALIVGGGGAGLTASMLLARHGVEHLLVSARATTSDTGAPAARTTSGVPRAPGVS